MSTDTGRYHGDPEGYSKLIEELYARHPPVTLPPEYAAFVENDLLRFLIRLARYKFVARLLKKEDRLLEIGSGSGLGSIFLSQHCAYVTGLEVKSTEVEEARALNRRENVEFRVGDLFEEPAEPAYDVVVALDVIEHLLPEEAERFVAAMTALLKPEGMLVIGTPSVHSYPHQSALSRASHVKCYDLPELLELLGGCCGRTVPFCMNDELVHTGHPKMAWYYFVLGFVPRPSPPAGDR
ncbi:MAG: class I SAM-dependent methyltransferase [Candidatus Methylomirabilia bacterium]